MFIRIILLNIYKHRQGNLNSPLVLHTGLVEVKFRLYLKKKLLFYISYIKLSIIGLKQRGGHIKLRSY